MHAVEPIERENAVRVDVVKYFAINEHAFAGRKGDAANAVRHDD
jgi:hypothetical protein